MSRPILAVDVDGVICLFGVRRASRTGRDGAVRAGRRDGALHLAGGRGAAAAAGEHFELVWATGWEDKANDYLPNLLGLPELPHVSFDGAARFGSATGSWARSTSTAQGRAWPGSTTTSTRAATSGRERRERADPARPNRTHLGLEEAHVEALIAASLGSTDLAVYTGRGGGVLANLLSPRRPEDPGLRRALARLVGEQAVPEPEAAAEDPTAASNAGDPQPSARAARARPQAAPLGDGGCPSAQRRPAFRPTALEARAGENPASGGAPAPPHHTRCAARFRSRRISRR